MLFYRHDQIINLADRAARLIWNLAVYVLLFSTPFRPDGPSESFRWLAILRQNIQIGVQQFLLSLYTLINDQLSSLLVCFQGLVGCKLVFIERKKERTSLVVVVRWSNHLHILLPDGKWVQDVRRRRRRHVERLDYLLPFFDNRRHSLVSLLAVVSRVVGH